MWDAMMAAEGSRNERAGIKFTQAAGPVLVAFQLLNALLGNTADTPGRADTPTGASSYAYISRSRQFRKVAQHLGHEHYEGEVWCPTTDNGTWFMEHNGHVIITGNSNGSLQLFHYLPQKPAYMAGTRKFKNFIEAASPAWRGDTEVVPEELRPKWMQEQQAAQIFGGRTEGSAFLLRSWFPFEEAQTALSLPIDPGEAARKFLSGVRPGIKFGVETALKRDIFRDRPLKQFGMLDYLMMMPKAVLGRSAAQQLNNLVGIRPLKEYGRRVWEQPTVARRVARGVIGGAIQPLSAERGLRDIHYETRDQLAEIRRRINRAIENKDEVEMRGLVEQYMAMMRYRQSMQLSVPKATQGMFQRTGFAAQPRYPGVAQKR